MFKLNIDSRRARTVAAGVGILAASVVAVIVALSFGSNGSPASVDLPTAVTAVPLQPTVLPDLAAKGVMLPQEMTLYQPRPSDTAAAIPKADGVASAQVFYPFAHLGDAHLLLMTDSQIASPRLVWIVTVLDRPTFQGGAPDATRPSYWLVFVDATTGKAMFGQSGEKVN